MDDGFGTIVIILVVVVMLVPMCFAGFSDCEKKEQQHEKEMLQQEQQHEERLLVIQQALEDPNTHVHYEDSTSRVVIVQCGPDGKFGTEDDTIQTFDDFESDPTQPQTQADN